VVNLERPIQQDSRLTAMITDILEGLWAKNKAKGLLAQAVFSKEIITGVFGPDAHEKIVPGCWLLAPKEHDFYKFRFCFFTHPEVLKEDVLDSNPKTLLGDTYRPFHAVAEFMNAAGVGVIYAVPATSDGNLPLEEIANRNFGNIRWHFFGFNNGRFLQRDPYAFFEKWGGGKGRPSYGKPWEPKTREKIAGLDKTVLTELLLTEIFLSGFLKSTLRKSISDPYDVDSFLISISQRHIFPMEIKEKFPGHSGKDAFFGIDAGRIMMLLRLCLPNDANAVYLIRELNEAGTFIGWKYITLSDIIMTASWNLQAGGPGMGGQSTQTIRLPYDHFREFTAGTISEDHLKEMGSLPKEAKSMARQFGEELSLRFGAQEQ
jgi:hypothetical protein